jgi:chromosome segregation ATPase
MTVPVQVSLTRITPPIVAAVLVLGAFATSHAQSSGRATAGLYVPSAATDSMLVLVEMRESPGIQRDLEEAAAHRSAAELRMERAKMMQARAATQIKIKESEIKALQAQVDLAKSEKNDLRKQDLEAQKKVLELEKKLLERREHLRQREIDLAKAEAEFLSSEGRAYERELDLAGLRGRRAALSGQTASASLIGEAQKLEQQIREMEGKTLEAKVQAAERRKKVAEQEISLNKARQKVFEAQLKLLQSAG